MTKKIKLATLLAALCFSASAMATDWDSKATYKGGETVTYQGKDWKAKWWTVGDIPGAAQWGPWELVSSGATTTPTIAPTVAPTTKPTTAPTVAPTTKPTTKPTTAPTVAPTTKPTTAPTVAPTTKPTTAPTVAPTAKPTTAPTVAPTTKPTTAPTVAPTTKPTIAPTVTPTIAPTTAPTVAPTTAPTATPLPNGNTCAPVWNPDEIYRPNLGVVIRSAYGQNYQANYYSSNIEPSTNSATGGAWKSLGACTGPSTPRASGPESLAEAKAHEAAAIQSPVLQMMRASVATLPNSVVEQVTPGNSNNPANVKRVEGIVSQQSWNYFFPEANAGYTYTNFLRAAAKFPGFCADYKDGRNSDTVCRHLITAFFAHVVQETGNHSASDPYPTWRQGLTALREGGDGNGSAAYTSGCADVNWQKLFDGTLACGKNPDGTWISYYGRGAHQISYIFNYAPLSLAIYGDRAVLRDNPDLVASTWLNMASAMYFFVTPQPPKPSVLHILDGTWVPNAVDIAGGLGNDFPTTSQAINGECMSNPIKPTAQERNNYYAEFARELKLDISKESMKCTDMKPFSGGSSAAVAIYWNKSEETADNPAPIKYQCRLTSEQSGFSALIDDQYTQCVEAKWSVKLK